MLCYCFMNEAHCAHEDGTAQHEQGAVKDHPVVKITEESVTTGGWFVLPTDPLWHTQYCTDSAPK